MDPTALGAELWHVDAAIAANEQQHQALLYRRHVLLDQLRRQQSAVAPPTAWWPQQAGNSPAGSWAPPVAHPEAVRPKAARESSPHSVQNMLLALGGLLLAVAAVVFTVVAWGRFGLAGRATILLGFTAVALGLPAWLMRRKLTATAETISLVGLVLMGMDTYAAYAADAFGLHRTNGFGYAAAATALIAAVAIGYPALVPVRLMRPAGLFVTQLPVPLAAVALHASAVGVAFAGTVAIAGNLLATALTRGRPALMAERWIAATFAILAALVAIPIAAALTFFGEPGRPAAVLALAGVVTAAAALLVRAGAWRAVLAGAALLLVGAAAVGSSLPPLGRAGALAPAGAALLVAAAALVLRSDWRRGSVGAASVFLGAGALSILWPVALATVGPLLWVTRTWTGAPADARSALSPYRSWSAGPSVLLTVVVLTAAAVIVAAVVAGRRRPALLVAAGGLVLAAVVAPPALDLSRPAALVAQGLVAAACCLAAARLRHGLRCQVAGLAGLALLAVVLAGSLAERTSTLVALGGTAAVLAAAAVLAGRAPIGAAATGLFGTAVAAEVTAVLLSAGGTGAAAAWALLAVAGVAVVAGNACGSRLDVHARALGIGVIVIAAAAAATALAEQSRPGLLLATAGTLVVLAGSRRPRGGEREAFVAVAAGPLLVALATVARATVEALFAPYSRLGHGWGTAPASARSLAPHLIWSGDALVPAVLAVAATGAVLGVAAMLGRVVATRVAVPAAALAVGLLPFALDLPWPVALAGLGAVALGLLAAAAMARGGSVLPPAVSGPTAAVLAGTVLAWSLATAPATVAALTALGAGALLAAVFGRTRPVARVSTALAATVALLDAVAAAMAAGLAAHLAAFAGLAVAAGLVVLAGLLRRHRPWESQAGEAVAAAGGLLGAGLTIEHPLALSLALAVAGLTMSAMALRPDRRWAWMGGAALLIASSWVRLADIGVSTPEAYTVAPAIVGLVIGILRRRQRPLSSWAAYGPGLAAGLLPSLAALFAGPPDTMRPLALGTAALLVLLTGARLRLQAPLLTGGGVLAAVAVHELAPAVAQLLSTLPRWLPLAVAGLLLLLLGATYEQRRRDLRRLRQSVSRMA